MAKLLLIDGNAVLHRAYYAMPDWRNRSGEATAGVYGFLSMLLNAIEKLVPTHLVVVFDTPEPTFRHVMYVGYQSGREKERQVSEDIWGQVEKLKLVFEKMNVPVFTVAGFEADDVIGTLGVQASATDEFEVVIITGDRDLMQLVNDKVSLYMPKKGLSDTELVDKGSVVERMGVNPDQIVDYKALVGDSSDNYPGVPGIGPKTAIDLIRNYSSFSNIYNNLEKIKESVKLKLADGYEAGKLSEQLATIRIDVPVTLKTDECVLPTSQKITEVLQELGYKSLIKRIGGKVSDKDDNQTTLFE
ncbi:hypothetical protein A2397_01700 [Candidatus Amesbacteria bacterium RIFOXYB1_FULL_44_23]|uniref:5'-3' exonuclease domain-containing protein n=1 Tax=Candidatus Amesbacteria bacterium RIFOXYB1_FULL_44_23 TaxID=1797263 RepID=A0A1F4ZU32_9BACT|nr:MAG: hypothetical protein A2397_01700 [Candidatus Amesbacteria bacterium RIFOXYB1_FULL_44_23]